VIFQRVNRDDPERVFIVVYNSTATAMTNGQPVRWDYTTDVNGVGVEKPQGRSTDNRGNAFAGVAVETIAASDYGLIQVYGYHSATICSVSTGDSVVLGTPLYLPITSGFYLETLSIGTSNSTIIDQAAYVPNAFGMQIFSQSATTSAIKVFIKGL
jgi:hypothetical protein